jgi:hypothetical protein
MSNFDLSAISLLFFLKKKKKKKKKKGESPKKSETGREYKGRRRGVYLRRRGVYLRRRIPSGQLRMERVAERSMFDGFRKVKF